MRGLTGLLALLSLSLVAGAPAKAPLILKKGQRVAVVPVKHSISIAAEK